MEISLKTAKCPKETPKFHKKNTKISLKKTPKFHKKTVQNFIKKVQNFIKNGQGYNFCFLQRKFWCFFKDFFQKKHQNFVKNTKISLKTSENFL